MTEESTKINIIIAGRKYPVLVSVEEESAVKKMEKEVNDKISEIQRGYDGIDKVDALSMTLLTYAFESIKKSKVSESSHTLSDANLDEINNILDTALAELSD